MRVQDRVRKIPWSQGLGFAHSICSDNCTNKLYGDDGNDTLYYGDVDLVEGGAGNDFGDVEPGKTTSTGIGHFKGGADNDTLIGSAFDDTIEGLGGNDTIIGNAGDDSILGGDGDDSLWGLGG